MLFFSDKIKRDMIDEEAIGKEEMQKKYAPAKRFDQTFLKFGAIDVEGERGGRMNLRIAIVFALISVIVALAPAIAIAASPIISIDSYTLDLDVNSNVTVSVVITNASAVAGGSVGIIFNPSIVNAEEVLPGDFGAPASKIDNANGSVHVAASRVSAVGLDEAILTNISFVGVSGGYTGLNIENATLNSEDGSTTTPETADGEIDVSASSDGDTDSHNGDGYTDSTTDAADDDSEKEKEKVFSNEPTAINIGSYTVDVDSNLAVAVPVEITHASAVAGGSANITFNPLFVNVEEILPCDFGTPIANINNDTGFVYIACASPTAVGKETAILAIVMFKGVSKGLTSLGIQDAALNDERGNLIALETTSGGEIEVRTSISTPAPFTTTNESITIPVSAPGEHRNRGVVVITVVIAACLVLFGGVIALLKRRKNVGR